MINNGNPTFKVQALCSILSCFVVCHESCTIRNQVSYWSKITNIAILCNGHVTPVVQNSGGCSGSSIILENARDRG